MNPQTETHVQQAAEVVDLQFHECCYWHTAEWMCVWETDVE